MWAGRPAIDGGQRPQARTPRQGDTNPAHLQNRGGRFVGGRLRQFVRRVGPGSTDQAPGWPEGSKRRRCLLEASLLASRAARRRRTASCPIIRPPNAERYAGIAPIQPSDEAKVAFKAQGLLRPLQNWAGRSPCWLGGHPRAATGRAG